MMLIDFEPGDYVKNPSNKDWGIGQVQSIIGNKVTVNFENYGKQVINVENVNLENNAVAIANAIEFEFINSELFSIYPNPAESKVVVDFYNVKEGLELISVDNVDDVLKVALTKPLIPIEWDEAAELNEKKALKDGDTSEDQDIAVTH